MKNFIEKLIGRLEEQIFSAELYNDEFDGQTVDNLICLGDVADTVNQLTEEYNNEAVKGDLISKSAFLKLLNDYVSRAYDCGGIDDENVIEYQQTHDDKSEYIIQGFSEVYGLLEDVPTTYINDWISCSEKLPELNGWYECWYMVSAVGEQKEYEPMTLYWEDNLWLYKPNKFNAPTQSDVVAWKPIIPYQTKGE